MTKEEYIKRFVAHMCKAAAISPEDELVVVSAEIFWDEHACSDDAPTPEDDADEEMSNWSE